MSKQKLLMVCLANAARSPTGEWLTRRQGYKVKSCGTSPWAHVPCNKELWSWADKIFVMEPYMKKDLVTMGAPERKINVLNVPEVGKPACEPSLVAEIKEKLSERGIRTRKLKDPRTIERDCIKWWYRRWNRMDKLQRRRILELEPVSKLDEYMRASIYATANDEPLLTY